MYENMGSLDDMCNTFRLLVMFEKDGELGPFGDTCENDEI